ncbi:hypothetical protein ZWY2020_040581 [Hordeum vulgare]|nr:hypothetical protein ZWY2020_040581 [Hordeum vulgare]
MAASAKAFAAQASVPGPFALLRRRNAVPRRASHWDVASPPAPDHGRACAKPWPALSAHARPCSWPPGLEFFLPAPGRQPLARKSASSVAFALDGDGGQGLVPQHARRRCVESF